MSSRWKEAIADLTGNDVAHGYTRGGRRHFWAEVYYLDGNVTDTNYKTGEMDTSHRSPDPAEGRDRRPWWGRAGPPTSGIYRPRQRPK